MAKLQNTNGQSPLLFPRIKRKKHVKLQKVSKLDLCYFCCKLFTVEKAKDSFNSHFCNKLIVAVQKSRLF